MWIECSLVSFVILSALLLGVSVEASAKVRKPAVAGQFYPADPTTLRRMVEEMLENARKVPVEGEIVGLVCPHAGYPYSGPTAAVAYKEVMGKRYDAVVVIGPSHREFLRGSSIWAEGGYETPLGVVPIAEDVAKKMLSPEDDIVFSDAGHRYEHSVEVELPFLQVAIPDLKVVPVVMGEQNLRACRNLADAIVRACKGKKVLIVASSDLYHGYSYEECNRTDERTLKAILRFDPEGFVQGLLSGEYQACGGGPIAAMLMAARELGADKVKILTHTNSNDVVGERGGYVVGYSAIAVYRSGAGGEEGKKRVGVELGLSEEDKRTLLTIARRTVERVTRGEPPPEFQVKSGKLLERRGAFVTLKKHGELRGCIGYIEGIKPLWEAVRDMARAAALEDPRFPPVRPEEVPELEIEISVLTPLWRVKDIKDIVIGRDGLIIRKGWRQGLLLPQVATEYGWDVKTFLEHTCLKAGLPRDAWKGPDAEIWAFSAEVFSEGEL